MLYLRLAHAQFVIARRGGNINELGDALLEFVESQRTVIQAARQAESMLGQRDLARPVTFMHAAHLRHRNVALVNDAQEVLGKVIDQRVRRLTWLTTIQMTRVILDTRAKAQRFQHFQVVIHAHFQALRFQQLAFVVELLQAVAQLFLDGFQCAIEFRTHRNIMRRRPNGKRLVRVQLFARYIIDFGDRFYLITPELNTDRIIRIRRKHIQRIAAHAKRTALEFVIVAIVLDVYQAIYNLVTVHFLLFIKEYSHTGVICRTANTVNARDTCHHNNVAAGKQRACCGVAQFLHFFVDGRILLDERIRRRHVRLGLVIIVVAHEVDHGVVREEFLELGGQLRRERFVGRQDERGFLDGLDGFRHGERFARTRYAQKRLVTQTRFHICGKFFDGLRLVARWLVRRNHLEGSAGQPCKWQLAFHFFCVLQIAHDNRSFSALHHETTWS